MFGIRLRELRKKALLTQQDLSVILNIDRTSIGKYETKTVIPSPDLLIKIANHFHVTIDYLLGRSDDEHIFREMLSPDLVGLIKKFDNLPPKKKAAVKVLLDLDFPANDSKPKSFIP